MNRNPWLMGREVTLPEMLDGREYRALTQQKLMHQYKTTLVCFTMNIAGPIKTFPLAEEVFLEGCRQIRKACRELGIPILGEEITFPAYGYEAYFVTDAGSSVIKKALTKIEEHHPMGRLFDIDVLRPDGSKVSREEGGAPPRRCLLCGHPAAECARSRTHTVEELQNYTIATFLKGIRQTGISDGMIGRLSRMALLLEVYTTPKPGLVDRNNNGAHPDMDVPLFEKSVGALEPYFARCAEIGRKQTAGTAAELLPYLRPPGRAAEQEMLIATKGVNTHKGMIFSLGIICGALGQMLAAGENVTADALLDRAGEVAYPALEADLKKTGEWTPVTAGERQYAAYGISGIRGEAAGGFRSVRQYGLPVLRAKLASGCDFEWAGVWTLLSLIANVTDTNMIARGGLATQQELQYQVRELFEAGTFTPQTVEALDRYFVKLNVSPGGCADLLAITYFIWLTESVFQS